MVQFGLWKSSFNYNQFIRFKAFGTPFIPRTAFCVSGMWTAPIAPRLPSDLWQHCSGYSCEAYNADAFRELFSVRSNAARGISHGFLFRLKWFSIISLSKNWLQKMALRVMWLNERNGTEPGDRNKAGAMNTGAQKKRIELISLFAERNAKQNCDYYLFVSVSWPRHSGR